MTNTRRQLILDIATMEKKLQYQRSRARAHEKYLVNLLTEYRILVGFVVLSSLFLSFKKGRNSGSFKLLKQVIRFGSVPFFAYFRR